MPSTTPTSPDAPAPSSPTPPTGVMDRTLAVLELLAHRAEGLQISAVSESLGIPLSATHRLLSDLAERGYVRQDRGHGAYRLTTRLVTLAFTYLAGSGITDTAQPVLDRLAAVSGELVRLAVVDGDRLTWVAKAQGAQSGLRYDPEMGQVAQLSCSSAGIAWLATMTDGEALRRVERQGFARPEEFGPRAPRTPKALLQHLRATRKRGYSLTLQTFTPWMAAMAAAVRSGPAGEVRGTVSIAGPVMRLTEERMREMAPALLAAAGELAEAAVGSPVLARSRGGASA